MHWLDNLWYVSTRHFIFLNIRFLLYWSQSLAEKKNSVLKRISFINCSTMVLFWSKKIMNRGVKILSKKAALDILSTKKWFFYQRLEEHVYLASIYRAHGVLNIINEKNLCPLWPHKIKIMVLKWKLMVTSWVVSLLGTLSKRDM